MNSLRAVWMAIAAVFLANAADSRESATIRITVGPGRSDWPHAPVAIRLDSILSRNGWKSPLGNSLIRVRESANARLVPSRAGWNHSGECPGLLLFSKTGPGRREYVITVTSDEATPAGERIPVVGFGEPLTHGVTGIVSGIDGSFNSNLAVADWDGDGDLDFFVAQGQGGGANWTMHGLLYYENVGTSRSPLMAKPRRLLESTSLPLVADWNGDGFLDICQGGLVYHNLGPEGAFSFAPPESLGSMPRVNALVDWNGDGLIDIVRSESTGGGDPSPSIWSKDSSGSPYTREGVWRGYTGHGRIIVHRNTGSASHPRFAATPETLRAGGEWLDVPGGGMPAFGDMDGDGDDDLLVGTTHDLFYFENIGTRVAPVYRRGAPLDIGLEEIYVRPVVADMNGDGMPDVLIAQENGDIKLVENLGRHGDEDRPRFGVPSRIQQRDPLIDAGSVGAFDVADVNEDGRPDIIASNSYGEVWQWFSASPDCSWVFGAGTRVRAGGKLIRIFAGASGSIQGPGEARYGYGAPEVADWNGDGALDLILADVWGKHTLYCGLGADLRRTDANAGLELSEGQPLRFANPRDVVKPAWNWWNPVGGELVTQWRTRGEVLDWNGDGEVDYVTIDHEGYLALAPGVRTREGRMLEPLERVFLNEAGEPLLLTPGTCGRSGRYKIALADWDGDGDMDLVRGVATPSGNTMHTPSEETGCAFLFENIGNHRFAFRGEMVPDPTIQLAGHSSCPQPFDFDGDGKLDLLIGAEDGHIYAFHRSYLEKDLPRVQVTRVRITH